MASIYRTWNEALSYYAVILAALGTFGNLLTFATCLRQPLRKVPTFVFMAVMSLTDACSLYVWNLNDYFLTFYGHTISDFNEFACKFTPFIQFFFSQSSSYLLIALTLERFLSVKVVNWRSTLFNSKKALITSLLIVLFFFALNVHLNFTIPFLPVANKSLSGICYSTKMYKDWRMLHTYVYSMIPFLILFILNTLLVYEVIKSNRKNKTSDKQVSKSISMTISVISFTIAFILLTGPLAFAGGYYLGFLMSSEYGIVILFIITSIAFTFHGSNLIILLCTNIKFRNEFKSMLADLKIIHKTVLSKTRTTNIATTANQ